MLRTGSNARFDDRNFEDYPTVLKSPLAVPLLGGSPTMPGALFLRSPGQPCEASVRALQYPRPPYKHTRKGLIKMGQHEYMRGQRTIIQRRRKVWPRPKTTASAQEREPKHREGRGNGE